MTMTEQSGTRHGAERVKQYKRARILLFVAGIVSSWITASLFVFSGASRRLTDSTSSSVRNKRAGEGIAIVAFILLSWIISFPLAFLRGYRLEHAYEMSNQSFIQWLGDQLKGLTLQLVLMAPMTQAMLGVIRRRPSDWWAVLSALAIPFTVILSHLAPVLILPLFNTYQPLRDRELAKRLKDLAARSGIDVADILEMDMSKQTRAANAFFTGVGSTRRIVLSDTLLDELSHDEIETIVAHEIGHQANRDLWRLLGIGVLNTAAIAWATQNVFERIDRSTQRQTGIRGAGFVEALPLLGLVASVVGLIGMPLENAYSRHLERKADRYALRLTDNPAAFRSGLDKIAEISLADPDPSRLEQVLLHSHPPIVERQAACDRYAASRN